MIGVSMTAVSNDCEVSGSDRRPRIALRQKVCRDAGDLAITESVDCNWHSLQHFKEGGFPTALILLESRSLGFNCFFPDGVLLVRGHQD